MGDGSAWNPVASTAAENRFLRNNAGAVVLFLGTTRELTGERRTLSLDYECYPEMAVKKMREVADEVRAKFPITGIGILHRTGRLKIGETSLLVAVSSPHRKDAFDACHWCVDRIKEVVPVWKKEHWADGSAWVEGHAVDSPEGASTS